MIRRLVAMRAPIVVEPWDIHNQTLIDNVHPPGWANPEPAPRYNLVVLGAGPAGLVSAIGAAGLGAKVALVEQGLMGGDCLNVGCVPSKAMLRAARAWADAASAGAFGLEVPPGARGDFAAVMARMRSLRAQLSAVDSARRYRDLGVDVFLGAGRFTGRDTVAVDGTSLRFRRAVIATGARAGAPSIPGLADAGYLTNETVFTLTTLPRRLVVIGAGPVGCELAQAFGRFGAEVTVLETAPRILIREDEDAAGVVARALVRDGVRLVLAAAIARVGRDGDERVVAYTAGGASTELRADEILVATGRIPNVDGVGLEAAGVAFDPSAGVTVDDRLRTTNPRVYAAGDVCSRYQLTHNADFQARTVLRNALFLGRARAGASPVPRVTYTDPEVAHVGLDAHEAAERGLRVRTFVQSLDEVDRAVLDGERDGFVKVHVREGTDRIVGATIVARHAGEMVSELTLAMAHGIGLGKIAATIHPYPTQAEAIRKAADAYNRTRLTPTVKRLLARWLSWTR